MLTQTDATAAADSLIERARIASPALQNRHAMPPWFADAPDGLDATGKQRLFDELREQARKVTGLGAILTMGVPIGLLIASGRHDAFVTSAALALPLVLALGLRLARRPLFHRMLRLHVKKNATW